MNKKLLIFLTSILSLSFVKANAVSDVNTKIMGAVTGISVKGVLNFLGWAFAILLIGGFCFWYFGIYSKNKKIFNKSITVNVNVGGYWKPIRNYDVAKSIKIGKGGFEILYLKKAKSWKIAYGGNFGDNNYEFYIMPDGYWYNGRQMADVKYMDEKGGLIQVVTTNPLMRGQYTALEKQIDSLHAEKQSWWNKYGTFVLSIAFVLVAGVIMWLMLKEWRGAISELASYHNQMGVILDKLSNLATNVQGSSSNINSGLVPA